MFGNGIVNRQLSLRRDERAEILGQCLHVRDTDPTKREVVVVLPAKTKVYDENRTLLQSGKDGSVALSAGGRFFAQGSSDGSFAELRVLVVDQHDALLAFCNIRQPPWVH